VAKNPEPESLLTQTQIGALTAGGRPYLGDPAVVGKILRDMVDVFLEETGPDRALAVRGAIDDAADILVGLDETYAPMGKWNTGDGLGNWIRGHVRRVPPGDTRVAVEYALSVLVAHFIDAFEAGKLGVETPVEAGPRLARLMRNWTTLMLGVPSGLGDAIPVQAPRE
jgi:hypothetical protein